MNSASVAWREFPGFSILSLYHDRTVYRKVDGIKSFEPWLSQLELRITGEELMKIAEGIPADWLAGEATSLTGLLECLWKRKAIVPELMQQALGMGKRFSS